MLPFSLIALSFLSWFFEFETWLSQYTDLFFVSGVCLDMFLKDFFFDSDLSFLMFVGLLIESLA